MQLQCNDPREIPRDNPIPWMGRGQMVTLLWHLKNPWLSCSQDDCLPHLTHPTALSLTYPLHGDRPRTAGDMVVPWRFPVRCRQRAACYRNKALLTVKNIQTVFTCCAT